MENTSDNIFSSGKRGSVDLLTGTPWKRLLLFAIPLIIGNLFQQLYNTVDAIIVGRWVGHIALAAVGVSTPVLFLLISIFMGVAIGSSVLVSQYYGAKSIADLRRTLHTSILLAFAVGLVLSVIGIIFADKILHLLNTPADTFDSALSYMRILYSGIIGQMMYNMLSGFMRGMGNSRTPLTILIISSLTNIVLDLIFVIPMQMGVAGAAWATIISQALSGILALVALHRTSPLTRISRKELKISWYSTKEIVKLGLPTAIQQAVVSLGAMVIQSFVNIYGSTTIAGYASAMKVDLLAVMPIMSFSMAVSSYTGQNVGAARMDRVYLGAKHGLILCASITTSFSVLLLIFGKYPLLLFTNNMEAVEAGLKMMHIIVPFYVLFSFNQLLGSVMRGSGETVIPMINSLTLNLLARIPLVILLSHLLQRVEAIYWSQVFGWVFGFLHMLIMYKRGGWKQKAFARIALLHGTAPESAGPAGPVGPSGGSGRGRTAETEIEAEADSASPAFGDERLQPETVV